MEKKDINIDINAIVGTQRLANGEFKNAEADYKKTCETNQAIWNTQDKDYKISATNINNVRGFSAALIDATNNSLNGVHNLNSRIVNKAGEIWDNINAGKEINQQSDIDPIKQDVDEIGKILKEVQNVEDIFAQISVKLADCSNDVAGKNDFVNVINRIIDNNTLYKTLQQQDQILLNCLSAKSLQDICNNFVEFAKIADVADGVKGWQDCMWLLLFLARMPKLIDNYINGLAQKEWNKESFGQIGVISNAFQKMAELKDKAVERLNDDEASLNDLNAKWGACANKVSELKTAVDSKTKPIVNRINNVAQNIHNSKALFDRYRHLRDADGQGQNNCFCNAIIPQKEGNIGKYTVNELRKITKTKEGTPIATDAIGDVSKELGRPIVLLETIQKQGNTINIAYPFDGNSDSYRLMIAENDLQANISQFVYETQGDEQGNQRVRKFIEQLSQNLCLPADYIGQLSIKGLIAHLLQNKNTIAMYYNGSAQGGHYQSYLTKEQYQRVNVKPEQQHSLIVTGQQSAFAAAQARRRNKK